MANTSEKQSFTGFTIEAIKAAHSQVKSGADFPKFIQDIIKLGVRYYDTYVADGHTDYCGAGNYKVSSGPRYSELNISPNLDDNQFRTDLKEHQQGKTSYFAFCELSAKSGIEKWSVCMEKMTCTYYDKAGNEVLVEKIPG